MTHPYQDIDQLHAFLKTIRSVDEFFEKKQPGFRDWYVHEMTKRLIEDGHLSEENALLGLKQDEKQLFVRLRDGL